MVIKGSLSRNIKLPKLYHISFRDNLEGIWTPRPPDGLPEEPQEDGFPYPEPAIGRISLSSTLKGCFLGIYPNIFRYFEEDNYPYLSFSVYSPVFTGKELLVTNEKILKDKLVWDAHITDEWWILNKVQMKLVGKIQVINPRKTITKFTYPFNDRSYPQIDFRIPSVIEVVKLGNFSNENNKPAYLR